MKLVILLILFMLPFKSFAFYSVPSKKEFLELAKESALSPLTLVPLMASLVVQYDHWDKRMSNKLRQKRPLFHTQKRADRASDNLRTASSVVMLASSLVLDCQKECFKNIGLNFFSDALASILIIESRNIFKYTVRKDRPNGDERSFASGHAAAAGARTVLGNLNFERSFFPRPVELTLIIANWLLAYTVAYARVEAKAHYPGDVLFSLALGNFVGNVLKKGFYFQNSDLNLTLLPPMTDQSWHLGLNWSF